jgi:hypothetical protein
MFKVSIESIQFYEKDFPGITRMAFRYENAILPPCQYCGSFDTADVQCGFVSITRVLARITTKFHLKPGQPRPGRFFCNVCRKYFTPEDWNEPIKWEDLIRLD